MVPDIYQKPPGQLQRGMSNITLTNPSTNYHGDWGHQLRGRKREGRIKIMFQNMVGIVTALDQTTQQKLYALKNTMINEGISIIELAKVNSNQSKIQ